MKKIQLFAAGCLFLLVITAVVIWMNPFWVTTPIRVGILHSQTGVLAVNEKRLLNAELLAIDEINEQGGINGRKLQPIVADGASDEVVFEQEALRLVTQEKVEVLMGCWTSACRKRVKPIVEKYDNLLLYPVLYEGIEESPNIVYFGSTPNQTIIPGITWCFDNLGKKFFVIGLDSVYSQVTRKILELHIAALGGEIVEQLYIRTQDSIPDWLTEKITATAPDVIINMLSGQANVSFFNNLRDAGITSEQIPTMSFRTSQADFELFELSSIIGSYVLFNYASESLYPFNQKFIEKFKKRYGKDSRVGDGTQAAYSAMHMWAQAYKESKSPKPAVIIPALKKIVYQSPAGILYLAENQHSWQDVFISKLAYNGDLVSIWKSKRAIHPEVYPPYLTKEEWNEFLTSLYESWGKRWSAK